MAKSRKSSRSSNKAKESAEINEDVAETAQSVTDAVEDSVPETEAGSAGDTEAGIKADAEEGAAGSDTLEDTLAATLESGGEDTATATDVFGSVSDSKADTVETESDDQSEATDATETLLGDDTIEAFDDRTESEKADETTGDESLVGETFEDTHDVADVVKEEPSAPAASTPVAAPRSSIWPAVFGGVIAALVGFIAGRGDQLDRYLPASMQRPAVDLTAIEAETAVLAQADETLTERIASLEALPERLVPLEELPSRLQALEEREPSGGVTAELADTLSGLQASVDALAGRVAALESRPVPSDVDSASSEDLAALQQAIEAQRAEISDLAAKAEAAEAKAASEAQRILARAALTRVITAVESGEAFSPALQDLEEVAPVEVPDPLRAAAEAGVLTMAQLQDSFPDAARAGLAAARADIPAAEAQSITGFLRRQLNVRSVTPREGDDPDAILSRAEAAVRAGDLKTALTEMEGLPESARTAMSDWIDAASARTAAQDAAGRLADSLNSN